MTTKKLSLQAIPPGFIPYGFIIVFGALNLFQAVCSELTSDEGYYWFLASRLEWGYYDHPPLLPLLINIGQRLFSNELGVRLADVLLICTGLVFLVKLLGDADRLKPHLYLILLSLPLLNYLTFIVFPDTPLIALSMIFLYFYKKFLDTNGVRPAIMLGLLLALMLYAKYHAVLIVLFLLISNLSLLRNGKFLFALGVAAALYLPHLYWQYAHDFVTVKYHLFGRSHGFEVNYLSEYVSVQALVLGPALIFVPFVYKTKDLFERALKFIAIGTLLFFLVSTFKGYVQFHWTSIVIFPIIIMGYRYYEQRKKKLLYCLTVPLFFFVLFLRLYLVFKVVPVNTFNGVDYFHNRKAWAEDIKKAAGGKTVVFENQLREAPLYSFYTGMRATALYPGENKKTQYQLWDLEDSVQGRDVFLIKDGGCGHCSKLETRMGKTNFFLVLPHFASYQNVGINAIDRGEALSGNGKAIQLEIVNHRSVSLEFAPNVFGELPKLVGTVHQGNGATDTTVVIKELSKEDRIDPKSSRVFAATIPLNGRVGEGATISFGFWDGIFGPSTNSKRFPLGRYR